MPPGPAEEVRRRVDRAFNGLLLVIAVQFLLGMWIYLFAPPSISGTFSAAVTDTTDPALIAHIVVGIILGVGAIATTALSFRDSFRPLRGFALGGLASIVFAGLAGSGFVYSGYSSAGDSFLMAVGFVAAVTFYYEGLVRLGKAPRAGPGLSPAVSG
jgi:hypothetical protein